MFNEVPIKYFGCTHRAIAPEKTITNVESKLRSAGVTRVAEITHLDRVGVPVYTAIRPSAAEGAVSIYAGKGATKAQAKASAMMESFERYSAELHDDQKERLVCGVYEGTDKYLHPRTLILPNLLFDPENQRLIGLDQSTSKMIILYLYQRMQYTILIFRRVLLNFSSQTLTVLHRETGWRKLFFMG